MIGKIESEFGGYYHVRIIIGSRYQDQKTMMVPSSKLQNYKVHPLQIAPMMGQLPDWLQSYAQGGLPLITDRPQNYPNMADAKNRISFGETPNDPPIGNLNGSQGSLGV